MFPQSNAEVSAGVEGARLELAYIAVSPYEVSGSRWARVATRSLASNASMASMISVSVGGVFRARRAERMGTNDLSSPNNMRSPISSSATTRPMALSWRVMVRTASIKMVTGFFAS